MDLMNFTLIKKGWMEMNKCENLDVNDKTKPNIVKGQKVICNGRVGTVVDICNDTYVQIDFGNGASGIRRLSEVTIVGKTSNDPNKFKKVEKTYVSTTYKENKAMKRDMYRVLDTSAQRIYDEWCERYNWRMDKRWLFGRQRPLYSSDVTPEGYSVWFLSHNNLSESLGGIWYNVIKEDRIEEYWKNYCDGVDVSVYEDFTTRVVFAKKKYGYVFLGVFKTRQEIRKEVLDKDIVVKGQVFKRAGETVWIKTYDKVSDVYSNEEIW